MSKIAPWLALACDWMDSEMFDDSSHGHRLAWICLLCHAKAQGRAGKVRFRDKAFAEKYRLSIESVRAMVASATVAKSVTVEDGVLTFVNWKSYQDPRVRTDDSENHQEKKAKPKKSKRFSKTSENDATHHPPPTTKHPSPPPSTDDGGGDEDFEAVYEEAKPMMERLYGLLEPQRKRKLKEGDREWVVKVAMLTRRHGDAWIAPAFEAMKATADVRRPIGLMSKELNDACVRIGTTLNRELASVKVPVKVAG